MMSGREPTPVNRIVLGTVQLGMPYGRHREATVPSAAVADAVFDAAWAMGIRAFDTATAYGLAAGRLAEWCERRGRWADVDIVTKYRHQDGARAAWLAAEPFRRAAGLTVLTHDPPDPGFATMADALISCGIRIGVSVYEAPEVMASLTDEAVTALQVPASIVSPSLARLSLPSRVRRDVRSVFLQGVLLDEPSLAERRAPGLGFAAKAVQAAARSIGLSPAAALAGSMLSLLPPQDRIVVGADSPDDLSYVADLLDIAEPTWVAFRAEVEAQIGGPLPDTLTDPRRWRAE